MEKVPEGKTHIGYPSGWKPHIDYVQVVRAEERLQGFMETFSYADVNEELSNEGENIRSLNGEFVTYCIEYCEIKEHTMSVEERLVVIEQDYKVVLRQVKVIVEETKVARLETSLKKKHIRDRKRKDPSDDRAASSRKKMRPNEGHDTIVEVTPSKDVASKRGKKK